MFPTAGIRKRKYDIKRKPCVGTHVGAGHCIPLTYGRADEYSRMPRLVCQIIFALVFMFFAVPADLNAQTQSDTIRSSRTTEIDRLYQEFSSTRQRSFQRPADNPHRHTEQFRPEDVIHLGSGSDHFDLQVITRRVAQVIPSIDSFHVFRHIGLYDQPGRFALIELLTEFPQQTAATRMESYVASTTNGNFLVPGIFVRQDEDLEHQLSEIALILDREATFIDAILIPRQQQYARVIRRKLPADPAQINHAIRFLDSYNRMIFSRDVNEFRELYADNALIQENRQLWQQRFTHYRMNRNDLVSQMQGRWFSRSSPTRMEPREIEVFRHDAGSNLFGIHMRKTLVSGTTALEAWHFIMVEALDYGGYRIHAHVWQPVPFKADDFPDIPYKPRQVVFSQRITSSLQPATDALTPVYSDNFLASTAITGTDPARRNPATTGSLSMASSAGYDSVVRNKFAGYIEIRIESHNPNLINATYLSDIVRSGRLYFTNAILDTDQVTIVDRRTIRVPFLDQNPSEYGFLFTTMVMDDLPLLRANYTDFELYHSKVNRFEFIVPQTDEIAETLMPIVNRFIGKIEVNAPFTDYELSLFLPDGTLIRHFPGIRDLTSEVYLPEGVYVLRATKPGEGSFVTDFQIVRGRLTRVFLGTEQIGAGTTPRERRSRSRR